MFALLDLNLADIEKVERVSINIPVTSEVEQELNLHQFEIFYTLQK